MTISAGFTAEQIRGCVLEYELQPYGQRLSWLAQQDVVSYDRLRRWRAAVFDGDLDRGLIPRQGSDMTMPPGERRALAASRAKEIAAHEAKVAKLEARVKELEEVNSALGKAIGLLHQMSEQEPDATPAPSDPSDS